MTSYFPALTLNAETNVFADVCVHSTPVESLAKSVISFQNASMRVVWVCVEVCAQVGAQIARCNRRPFVTIWVIVAVVQHVRPRAHNEVLGNKGRERAVGMVSMKA